jgi:DNA-binding NtrC family response regulator
MPSMDLKLLIVDDQPAVVRALAVLFDLHGIAVVTAGTPDEALARASRPDVGAVLQDMNFGPDETSGAGGIELFRRLRAAAPSVPVLLMTAWASLETAVQLVKEGAADYMSKPWDDDKLVVSVKNLLRMRALEIENARLRDADRAAREALGMRYDLCGAVYESEAMHRAVDLAATVAGSDAPVLITGPSGAGKEKLAEIVQANSRRRDRPFLRVNVGAIPEELMESELFGAEAGAYTGSTRRRDGYFEAANGGTLFLDEIDALSLPGQVKLLRVLQSGEYQRLGSSATRRADVRIVSATNADLRQAIAGGRFREDLFYRLNVIEIVVPPLACRPEDILPLALAFLDRASPAGSTRLTLAAAAERALLGHAWDGNVRELDNRVQRAVLVRSGDEIRAADLDLVERDPARDDPGATGDLPVSVERRRIERALVEAEGVVSRAAEGLGLSRQALYRKMDRLGIVLERRPRDGAG